MGKRFKVSTTLILVIFFLSLTTFASARVMISSILGSDGRASSSQTTDVNTDWNTGEKTGVRIYPVKWDTLTRTISRGDRYKYLPFAVYITENDSNLTKGAMTAVSLDGNNVEFEILPVVNVRDLNSGNIFVKTMQEHKDSEGKTLASNDWIRSASNTLVSEFFSSDSAKNQLVIEAYLGFIKEKVKPAILRENNGYVHTWDKQKIKTRELYDEFCVDFQADDPNWVLVFETVIQIFSPRKADTRSFWISPTEYAKVVLDYARKHDSKLPGLNSILDPYAGRVILAYSSFS